MTKKMIFIVTIVGLVINLLLNLYSLIFRYESSNIALRVILSIVTIIAGLLIIYEMHNSLVHSKYSLMIAIFAIIFGCGAGGVMYILWFKNIGRAPKKKKVN